MVKANHALSNSAQKHYPDLGSETSSVWNFCVRSSNVISRGTQCWRGEKSVRMSTAHRFVRSVIQRRAHRTRANVPLAGKQETVVKRGKCERTTAWTKSQFVLALRWLVRARCFHLADSYLQWPITTDYLLNQSDLAADTCRWRQMREILCG